MIKLYILQLDLCLSNFQSVSVDCFPSTRALARTFPHLSWQIPAGQGIFGSESHQSPLGAKSRPPYPWKTFQWQCNGVYCPPPTGTFAIEPLPQPHTYSPPAGTSPPTNHGKYPGSVRVPDGQGNNWQACYTHKTNYQEVSCDKLKLWLCIMVIHIG